MKKLFWVCLTLSLGAGAFIGWMDSRPHWDDTGITVGAIVLSAGVLGILHPQKAWLWATLIGLGVTVWEYGVSGTVGAVVSIPIAFAAAYMGVVARRLAAPQS